MKHTVMLVMEIEIIMSIKDFMRKLNYIFTKSGAKWDKTPTDLLPHNRPFALHGSFASLRPFTICVWAFYPILRGCGVIRPTFLLFALIHTILV